MSQDEFEINDPNWRKKATNDLILLDGTIEATEYEVMLAIEKLTPITQKKYGRNPTEADVIRFIYMLRGSD